MKRVLMLGYFFPPSKAAGTFRTLRFVRDLPQYGWKPHVFTVSARTYPERERDWQLLHKVPNTVSVTRTPAPPYHRWFKDSVQRLRSLVRGERATRAATSVEPAKRNASAERTAPRRIPTPASISEWIYTVCRTPDIDAGWYAFGLLRGIALVLRARPDVLYATGGPWATFLLARDISRWTGVRLVLDYRDPWSHNPAVQRGGGFFEKLAHRLEASAVAQATRIVANTDVLRETLIAAHGPQVAEKTVIIHNSFDERDYASPRPPQSEIPTLCYVGSLYDAHSPEPFLTCLQKLFAKRPEVRGSFRVLLVGSGAPRTAQMVLALGLSDVVEVRAPVSHAEAVDLQRSAHALLLFLTVASDNSTFIPSKLFEYIAARRPIFAMTRGGALRRILERRDLTRWVYAPDDSEGMSAGIEDFLERNANGTLPELPDDVVRSFSGASAARALAAVLDGACGSQPIRPYEAPQPETEELQPAGTE